MKLYACRTCPCGCGELQVIEANMLAAIGAENLSESEIRDLLRESLKEASGAEYVWFEDESGTVSDPINGPIPQYGPKAEAANMN